MHRADRPSGGVVVGRKVGVAISPRATAFGPMMFVGQLAEGIRLSRELGFDLIELSLRDAGDVDRDWLPRTLARSKLKVSAIATGQACLFDGLCLSSSDASVRAATVSHLKREIQLAAELGAAIVFGGVRGRLEGDASTPAPPNPPAPQDLPHSVRFP